CTIRLTPRATGARFSIMKLITTIVRPERLPEVKAALFQAGITGITLSRVSGHGGEQEIVSQYRGTTVVMEFHEKVKIEMVCSEPFVEACIEAILASARTGEGGGEDGGPRVLRRRPGAAQERAQSHDDERGRAGSGQRAVGAGALLHRVRARHALVGRAFLARLQARGRGSRPRVRRHDSAAGA